MGERRRSRGEGREKGKEEGGEGTENMQVCTCRVCACRGLKATGVGSSLLQLGIQGSNLSHQVYFQGSLLTEPPQQLILLLVFTSNRYLALNTLGKTSSTEP